MGEKERARKMRGDLEDEEIYDKEVEAAGRRMMKFGAKRRK
jgi:hypothetical protein